MTTISIILPIYNLLGDRFNNFCFILKSLYELIDTCEIVVVEQTSGNPNIQRFLYKYPKTKHISVDVGEVFNKSKLINHGIKQLDTEYIWIVDGDFYTDFAYVLSNVTKFTDFTRPFSKTIMLTENETESLQELNYITITRDEYKTNKSDGKFSFIIKRSAFLESGMMNESFIGWGFQDLDFIENRLIECEKSYIDILAFHQYHEPASRKYVNRNKRLYLNISYEESVIVDTHLTESGQVLTECKTEPLQDLPEPDTSVLVEDIKVEEQLQPMEYRTDITLVYQKIYNSHVFPEVENVITIDVSTKKIRKRDMSGRIQTESAAPHFMISYLNFIVENYHRLVGIYVFSTDLFSTTPDIFGHREVGLVVNCVEHGFLNFGRFMWITPTTPLRLRGGHSSVVDKKSKYAYNKWVCLYTDTKPKLSPKYSLAGSFAVDSEHIKKHKVEYYERILVQSPSWVEEDYLFFMASLGNIFA